MESSEVFMLVNTDEENKTNSWCSISTHKDSLDDEASTPTEECILPTGDYFV